jgi:hypothetical protein
MNNPKEPTPEEIVAKIRPEWPEDADVAQKLLYWSRQHFTGIRTTPEGWNIVPEFRRGPAFSPFVIQKKGSEHCTWTFRIYKELRLLIQPKNDKSFVIV